MAVVRPYPNPFRFTMKDKSWFCMAGLWNKWIKPPRIGEFDFNDLDETPASRVGQLGCGAVLGANSTRPVIDGVGAKSFVMGAKRTARKSLRQRG